MRSTRTKARLLQTLRMPDFDLLVAKRDAAIERGDRNLAAEITIYLERNGYVETAVRSAETVTPPRPRGRPRKSTT